MVTVKLKWTLFGTVAAADDDNDKLECSGTFWALKFLNLTFIDCSASILVSSCPGTALNKNVAFKLSISTFCCNQCDVAADVAPNI